MNSRRRIILALVAAEYREQDRLFRFGEHCVMGQNASSRLQLIWQLAKEAEIPMISYANHQ